MPRLALVAYNRGTMIRTKRIYEPATRKDGCRVLVDRIWPRGISRPRAQISDWVKALAPSTDLRRWFGHDPEKWTEFIRRYRRELRQKPSELRSLRALVRAHRVVTLVYAARDEHHNNAVVLRRLLRPTRSSARRSAELHTPCPGLREKLAPFSLKSSIIARPPAIYQ